MRQENENTPSDTSDWDENIQSYMEGLLHLDDLQREPEPVSPVREFIPEVLGINKLPDKSGYEGDNEAEEEED